MKEKLQIQLKTYLRISVFILLGFGCSKNLKEEKIKIENDISVNYFQSKIFFIDDSNLKIEMINPEVEFYYLSRLNIIRELSIIDNIDFFQKFESVNFVNYNPLVIKGQHCEDNRLILKSDIEKMLVESQDIKLMKYKRYIYEKIDYNKIFYFNSAIKAIYEYKLEIKDTPPDFVELIYLYHNERKKDKAKVFYKDILILIKKICIEKKLFKEFKEIDIDFFLQEGNVYV